MLWVEEYLKGLKQRKLGIEDDNGCIDLACLARVTRIKKKMLIELARKHGLFVGCGYICARPINCAGRKPTQAEHIYGYVVKLDEPFTPADIAEALGIPIITARIVLSQFAAMGLLHKYYIGGKLTMYSTKPVDAVLPRRFVKVVELVCACVRKTRGGAVRCKYSRELLNDGISPLIWRHVVLHVFNDAIVMQPLVLNREKALEICSKYGY